MKLLALVSGLVLGQVILTVPGAAVRSRGGAEIYNNLAVNGDGGVTGFLEVWGSLRVHGDAGIDGRMADRTVRTLLPLQVNAINTVTCHGGDRLDGPVTVTNVSIYVGATSVAAGTDNVLRVSDGTNHCDATFACTTTLNTTGVKEVVPTGTCGFDAGVDLTVCETTAGCTPDPNIRNIMVKGYYR